MGKEKFCYLSLFLRRIKRLFTAWRVSHTERTERRAERKEDGEDDSEEDEPVEIQSVVRRHDASEGDPSSGIIRRGTSVRRERTGKMTGR